MISSDGENTYPAKVERVLMEDPPLAEAGVVKRRSGVGSGSGSVCDLQAGVFVTADELVQVCRFRLSAYKCPREIGLVASQGDFPRVTSGKVQRQRAKRWAAEPA